MQAFGDNNRNQTIGTPSDEVTIALIARYQDAEKVRSISPGVST